MHQPKLGYTLWKRKTLAAINRSAKSLFNQNNLSSVLGILISIFSLYLAVTANRISKESKKVAKQQVRMQFNDQSQQKQLNKLVEILDEVRQERILSDQLNTTTQNLTKNSLIQSDIVLQQLTLAKKLEVKNSFADSLTQNANMLSVIITFNELFDPNFSREAIFLYNRPDAKGTAILQNLICLVITSHTQLYRCIK